jgi:uncharacterized membrane protein YhhN
VRIRVQPLLLGLAAGIVPLLLLDLARILYAAHLRDGGDTTLWWPIACWVAVGVVVAFGVAAGQRERLVPVIGGLLVLLVTLPTVPTRAATWLPTLPVVPSTLEQQVAAFVIVGAYVSASLRGRRG